VLDAALRASDAHDLLVRACGRHPVSSHRQLSVVAAGKAARPMADAFVTRHAGRVREAFVAGGGHPVPDAASVASGARALRLADDAAQRGDLLVVLLSGGASAMLCAPAEGISLDDKAAVTRLLLSSGLAIGEMNAVRKHLSSIKGGWLGVRAGGSVTFALSDVCAPVEDDPAVIGSGPTVADPSTFGDAEGALRAGGLWDRIPSAVRDRLSGGAGGELPETPKPGDARLAAAEFVLAGSRRDAMTGARDAAASLGYDVEWIDTPTTGEARVAAAAFVARARERAGRSTRPFCIVASGETTVSLPSDPDSPARSAQAGAGGRNQEFALAAAEGLSELADCALASVGTDGIDGPTDAAGAIADSTTLTRARALGLDPAVALAAHDSHTFFRALGDLIMTGPTSTNVGDLQILLRGQV
jgi:glycerate 2-kinase